VPIVFHGEWSSPSLVEVNGEKMVIFGDGYGVLHGFAIPEKSEDGEPVILEELWTFDLNPHEFRYDEQGRMHPYTLDGRLAYKYPLGWFEDEETWIPLIDETGRWRLGLEGGPSELIGAPTIVGNRAYLGLGRDYNYDHGDVPAERGLNASEVRHRAFGKGRFMCLEWDDIRNPPRVRWEDRDVARLQACASVHDGLVYIVDNAGFLNCWDADTGEVIYKHDLGSTMRERSQIVADGKIYVGDDRSRLQILTAGRDVELLDMYKLKNHMATIEPTDGHLLVATGSDLIYFATDPPAKEDESAEEGSAEE
jgi:outer membrane protein assembly factor BamB